MNKHFLLLILVFSSLQVLAQRGKDGDYTVSAANEVLNTYTPLVADISTGQTTITVQNNNLSGASFSGNLSAGDLILIYQIQGGDVDINTHPTTGWGGNYTVQQSFFGNGSVYDHTEFGAVTNYSRTGYFEYAEVESVSGSQSITLTCPIKKNYYGTGWHRALVVRVPRYQNLTVPAGTSITALDWNGEIGGIVALEVEEDITIASGGEITANGKGFRGGEALDNGNGHGAVGSTTDINSRGYLGSSVPIEGALKGESIYGDTSVYRMRSHSRYSLGAIANGGGGGSYHNAGGGGGSNVGVGTYYGYGVPDRGASFQYDPAWNLEAPGMATTPSAGGGRGGYTHTEIIADPLVYGPHDTQWGDDYRRISGGVGGHPLTYDAERVFVGGGGGAGHENDGFGGSGGDGGGIVFIRSYGTITGSGLISANGEDGEDAEGPQPTIFQPNGITGDDGAGGAGGGGSVVIENLSPLPSTLFLEAKGGNGGNQVLKFGSLYSDNQADGTGGGGAGGLISFSTGTPNQDVSGGEAGVTNSSIMNNFPMNGATGGASGMDSQTTVTLDIVAVNDTICSGESATLSASFVGTYAPTPTLQWYENPVGGAVQGTGNTFTTPTLTSSTTYYVGACELPYRVPVEVVVTPGMIINGLPPTITDETCAGNDGAISGISVSGGAGSFVYAWNGSPSPTADLSGVSAGSYTLTVTDDNSCTANAGPFTINIPSGPTVDVSNMSISDETCAGNDGSITGITVSGGATPYTFEWNGNVTPSVDLTGANNGTYTLTVTDDNSCSSTVGPFTINSASAIVVDVSGMSITNESCLGNDAAISGISVSGGTGTLTYAWSPSGLTTLDISGVSSGSYTLTVTDGGGCSINSGPHVVNQDLGPTLDDANIVISNALCGSSGSISGLTAAGTGLSYSWAPSGETVLNPTNLSPGSHTLTITDGAGCTVSGGPYTITSSGNPVLDISNISISDETCNGNDGEITGITTSGGATPYTFTWNGNTSPDEDLSGATAGSYTLVVTDDLGCTASEGPFTINTLPSPTIDATGINVTDETCAGNDGSISGITVSGGSTPYTYDWNGNASPDANLNGANGGTYTLTVTDDEGCVATAGPFTINSTTPINIDEGSMAISDATCGAVNGGITGISVTGGTGALSYTWSPSGATTLDLNAVPNGSYTLTVTDNAGCTATSGPHIINQIGGPVLDLTNLEVKDATCGDNNGSVSGISTTGTGLTYVWAPSGQTTIDANNLSAGAHTLTITDNSGCSVTSGPHNISAIPSPTIDISNVQIVDASCAENDGSIQGISVSGGTTPYVYQWNGEVTDSLDIESLIAGTYNLIVTDSNGCEVSAGPFDIDAPIIPFVDITTLDQTLTEGESVTINTVYTPDSSTLSWNPTENLSCSDCPDPVASPTDTMYYVLTVTSPDGCTRQDSIRFNVEDPCMRIQVPTIFSPNNDNLNDELCVIGNCIHTMQFQIFNRWGEKVFETSDINECWDGTYRGGAVNTGSYVYKLRGTRSDGSTFNYSGNVNLLR
ncbi:T9SS type B sorting domain-containing protein [Brumimicrobium salinarum]|nr:gliding motility-associated C-terminal domain-containing protein [Brumimicrobium salinarum]